MYRSVSWSFAYITDRPADWTGAGRRRWTCGRGRPVHSETQRPYSVELPLSETRRLGFLPSVGGPPSRQRNEGLLASKSGRGHVWKGNEEEEEVGTLPSYSAERQARQSKARQGEGINWGCSLNTNVAWRTRPPSPPAGVAESIRGTISHRHSARELAVAHTRADRPTDRRVRPSLRPSAPLAGAHQPHMPK